MFKTYNSYSIIHKNGQSERLNAETMEQALQHMAITEEESPVSRALMLESGVRTYVEDVPDEIVFTAVVNPEAVAGGNIATPASGTVHIGDEIQLRAIPARTYKFVSWERNGVVIGTEATLDYTMTALVEGEDSAIFTANFALAEVEWTTAVLPATASGAGCIAFPTSGTTEANTPGEFLAVPSAGYAFDHWERNGEVLSDNKLMQLDEVKPLASNELNAVYTAVFKVV